MVKFEELPDINIVAFIVTDRHGYEYSYLRIERDGEVKWLREDGEGNFAGVDYDIDTMVEELYIQQLENENAN